jgi:hypothetical protein
VNASRDTLFQALDGRSWYFPEVLNGWSTYGSLNDNDWFEIDFGKDTTISSVTVNLLADHDRFGLPGTLVVEHSLNGDRILDKSLKADELMGNTANTLSFASVRARKLRLTFHHPGTQVFIPEIGVYE